MFAKQTLTSASLIGMLLGLVAPPALADGEFEPDARAVGEAAPDDATTTLPDGAPVHVVVPGPPAVKRPPTGRFAIGAGYRTDDGFVASAEVAQDDLFGTGNALSLSTTISERRQRFLTRFVDPDLLGSQLRLSADLYNDVRQLPGFWRQATGGAVELSAPLEKHLRAFVGYRLELVTTSEDNPFTLSSSERRVARENEVLIGSVRGGLVYDSRDALYAPRHGTHYGVAVEVADPSLGSDIRLRKLDVWADHHRPLGPLTLHVGGRLSSISSSDALGIPPSERLYLDGSSELRGFKPGALSPLGGEHKATGRAELEVPLIPKYGLSLVGFVDAAAITDGAVTETGTSVGAGLLWRSPLGPLRLDYAVPLDGGKPSWVLGVGGAF